MKNTPAIFIFFSKGKCENWIAPFLSVQIHAGGVTYARKAAGAQKDAVSFKGAADSQESQEHLPNS